MTQLDIFEWAESRPSAQVIDAKERFAYRTVSHCRALMEGYQPIIRDGEVISLPAKPAGRAA